MALGLSFLDKASDAMGGPFARKPQPQRSSGLTQAEAETLPYLREEVTKQKEEGFNLLTPLEFLFDVLSVGQYITANMGEDIARAAAGEDVNILQGMWEGLTLQRKGDWRTTLFGGTDPGEKRRFGGLAGGGEPDWMREKFHIPLVSDVLGEPDMRDVLGFVANMALDPLTYVSFGATKAGKKAAQSFKKQAVKGAFKQAGNIDEIAKVAREGFNPQIFDDLLEQGGKKAERYMRKYVKQKDFSRIMNNITKQAEKEALKMTAEEAQKRLVSGAIQNKEKFLAKAREGIMGTKKKEARKFLKKSFPTEEARKGLSGLIDYDQTMKMLKDPKTTPDQARAMYERLLGAAEEGFFKDVDLKGRFGQTLRTVDDYAQEIKRMESSEFAQQFIGMGERSVFNFFGAELGKYQYKPGVIARSWDKLKDSISQTKLGRKFSDAAWAIWGDSSSPIGFIRHLFGFRNPYQQLLRAEELNAQYLFREVAGNKVREVADIFNGVDKDISRKVRDMLMDHDNIRVDDFFNADFVKRYGIKDEQLDQVKKLMTNVQEYTASLNAAEKKLFEKGLLKTYETRYNYLPVVGQERLGRKRPRPGQTMAPGFTQEKAFDWNQRVAIEREKIKMFTGLDNETVEKLIREKNWSTINMDLEEMLMHRGLAHAQAVRHAEFIESFRQFGVNFKMNQIKYGDAFKNIPDVDVEKSGELIAALRMNPQYFQEVGLKSVASEGFENFYFDKDVAAIIDRVNPVLGSDVAYKQVSSFWDKATGLWRGYATLTPGFHLRNAKSNLWSLYMKDGVKALNFVRAKDSTIAAAYALGEEKFLKALPDRVVNNVLNKRIGDKTIKEWAEFARKRGIISRTTKGFDFQETVEAFTDRRPFSIKKANPLSGENVALSASRRFGAVVESSPKFSSFLNDIENLAKYGDVSEEAAEWAITQSKKWFFDYDDLSDFEKNVLKKVIPFYTWMRKNIALQLTQLGEKKGFYSQFAKLTKFQQDEGVDLEDIPEWAREEGYIPLQKIEDNMTRFLAPGLPYTDVNRLPVRFKMENGIPIPIFDLKQSWDEFLQMASPEIQTFAMLTSEEGYSTFRKKDMGPDAPAPRFMRLAATNDKVLPMVDSMLKSIGHEPGLNARADEDGRLRIDSKTANILETWMLPLERIAQAEMVASTFLPQIEEAIDKASGYKDKYQGMEKLFQTLSFLLGYKQKDIDADVLKSQRYREALKRAEAARSRDRKRLPKYQKSLDKYRKAAEAKRKRYEAAL